MNRKPARRHLRFYYPEFMRDYPEIYADDCALSSFLRLLAAAEMAWPATPEVPRSVKARGLRMLSDKGLVKVVGHSFILKGFVKERTERQQTASNAAAVRWQSDSNADADASAMPKRGRGEDKEREARQGPKPLEVAHPQRSREAS